MKANATPFPPREGQEGERMGGPSQGGGPPTTPSRRSQLTHPCRDEVLWEWNRSLVYQAIGREGDREVPFGLREPCSESKLR